MGKTVIFSTMLVLLLVTDVSNAAVSRNFRRLAASPPNNVPNKPGSESPVLPSSSDKGKEKKQIEAPPATVAVKGSSEVKKVPSDTQTTPVTPPTDDAKHTSKDSKQVVKDREKEENEKGKKEIKEDNKNKEKRETKPDVPLGVVESCDHIVRRCQDKKSMTACIKSFDYGSKALVLLIQNKGDSSLKVNLIESKVNVISIPKLQSKEVKVSLADGILNEITLNAGSGHCVLHLGAPASRGNIFQLIPSYSKFITPVYGVYLMVVITLTAGGVFACCWFKKRKGQRDIPYQELEMSMPESAVASETAEGWDEVWDDDWDEENAVRSPGGHSISANGLTSRNSKKDDWEDWDD